MTRLTEDQVERIRRAMDAKGWDQAALAREAKLREGTVGDALRRARSTRRSTVHQICAALGLSVEYVMTGAEASADRPGLLRLVGSTVPTKAPQPLGLELWLTETEAGRATCERERELLRAMVWPNPWERYPDLIYELALTAIRHALAYKSP